MREEYLRYVTDGDATLAHSLERRSTDVKKKPMAIHINQGRDAVPGFGQMWPSRRQEVDAHVLVERAGKANSAI